jgi:predicted outer membrane repeat protein
MKNIILIVFIIFYLNLSATIINVPDDQPTIQEGINIAVNSDTVLVQPGTYFENINYNGKNITVASLFITTQDTTYISQTIIDGDDNGHVVKFSNGEDSIAVLTGFTITNGFASGNYPDYYGGGIYCGNNCNPSLQNIIITDNGADYGCGIYCGYWSSPSLENVTISGNFTGGSGGGIYCAWYSSPSLINVTISGNFTVGYGSGIYCYNSSPSLINVTITDNFATYGGGIYCHDSNPSLENVTITDNSATYGGGICCNESSPNLVNVVIANNSAANMGGGIYCHDSNPSLINSILWNDSPEEIYIYSGSVTTTYSDIEGGWAGSGNIDGDPLFGGTGEDPYSLLENSPCIDAGIPDTTGLNLPPWDLIGNIRIWDGDGNGSVIIDMGAYEYGAPPYVDIDDNVIVQTPEILLHQNFPNPFNPETTIKFNLIESGDVKLKIYNIKGQKVKTLFHEVLAAGQHSVAWNGKDDSGKPVSSGIYFYKLNVNGKTEALKKCLLLK